MIKIIQTLIVSLAIGIAIAAPSGPIQYASINGITGILSYMPSTGLFSQGACGGLSNSGTACQASTGTSGHALGFLNTANVASAQQSTSATNLIIGGSTFTPDGSNNNYTITLVHASCPCTIANPSVTPVAGTSGTLLITQSATGSDTIGTWGSSYLFTNGAPTLQTGGNISNIYAFYVQDSTHIWVDTPVVSAGTVTTVSVASANGFAGTVANATTTPAITITTSITGALKGNGTAVSQAACSDLSNGAASCSTDTTNASNISSGTLGAALLPTITNSKTITFDSTTAVTAQTISFPIEWTSYTITKVQSAVNGGGSFTAKIKIGSTDVTSCNAISVSGATNTNTTCTAANTGSANDIINVILSAPSGTVNQAYVAIVFTHTVN